MKAVIRIHGQVNLDRDIAETLNRLNLKRKYSCIVLEKPGPVQLGMIKKVKDFVAYGNLDKDTHDKLVKARGKKGKKVFRLHPPRGGADTRKHFGVKKGILGNNKDKINDLIRRML
ncbi:MAG: uL30 family ribosomal protein [archaeon]